jgi:hypothetical protein
VEVGGGSRAHFVVARPRAPLSLLLHRSHLAINAQSSVIVECSPYGHTLPSRVASSRHRLRRVPSAYFFPSSSLQVTSRL